MKADYTSRLSRPNVSRDGDNRQMKADYTLKSFLHPFIMDGDNRQMKADYTPSGFIDTCMSMEITAK